MKKSSFLDRLANLLYVPKCVACKTRLPVDTKVPLCNECLEKWENEKHALCPTCGQEIEYCWCGIMDDRDGVIEKEAHLVAYTKNPDSVGRKVILASKYRKYTPLFDMLSDELIPAAMRIGFDENTVLVYVPRGKHNLKKFGHDQSGEIARRLSEKTAIPLCKFLINKGRIQQKTLSFRERVDNAKRSFLIDKEKKETLKGKNVILFDDLVTTGATVTRCAILLKRARAESVSVLSVGKTAN